MYALLQSSSWHLYPLSKLCLIKYIIIDTVLFLKPTRNRSLSVLQSSVMPVRTEARSSPASAPCFFFMDIKDRSKKFWLIPSTERWSSSCFRWVMRFDPDTQHVGTETFSIRSVQCLPVVSRGGSDASEVTEVNFSSQAGHPHMTSFCHSSRRKSTARSPDLWTSLSLVRPCTLLWRHAGLWCGWVLGFGAWWSRRLLWWER